ncbi:hypothetical protein JOM49_005376 [Amycolatopsis magusensis]|uniref:Uncharacterized protein n=1 Tax=Amycolatopsis magusensis TaxID=882444 RepID=A0ABS4PWQ3_9PSEU|nr:hypothetical protein [Amycolatopsis magusensis]
MLASTGRDWIGALDTGLDACSVVTVLRGGGILTCRDLPPIGHRPREVRCQCSGHGAPLLFVCGRCRRDLVPAITPS